MSFLSIVQRCFLTFWIKPKCLGRYTWSFMTWSMPRLPAFSAITSSLTLTPKPREDMLAQEQAVGSLAFVMWPPLPEIPFTILSGFLWNLHLAPSSPLGVPGSVSLKHLEHLSLKLQSHVQWWGAWPFLSPSWRCKITECEYMLSSLYPCSETVTNNNRCSVNAVK